MQVKIASFLALAGFSLAANAGWWSSDGEVPYGKWSMDYVSPHLEFAVPNAAKPKVFVTAFGVGQREIVELKERFDCDLVLFPVNGPKLWSPFDVGKTPGYAASMDEPAYREATEKLYAELPTCDVVLIGKSELASIPTNALERLLGRVKEGAGLLWIAFGEKPETIPGATLQEVNPETFFHVSIVESLKGTHVYEGTLGQGRVLQIVYRFPKDYGVCGKSNGPRQWLEPITPFESEDPLGYDLCHAFVGKCLWRVTGWDGNAQVASAPGPSVEISHDAKTDWWNGGRVDGYNGGSMEVGQRRGAGQTAGKDEKFYNAMGREVPETSRSAVAKVTRFFNDKGETVDYEIEPCACGALGDRALPAVGADRRAARLSLTLENDAYLPGEKISGAVKLAAGDKGTLVVSLTDEFDVEIARREVEVGKVEVEEAVEVPFDFTPILRNGHYAQVRAALYAPKRWFGFAGGELVDETWGDVYFNRLAEDRGEFSFTIWDSITPFSRVNSLKLDQHRRAGIDCVMEVNMWGPAYKHLPSISRRYRRRGLNYAHYVTRITGPAMDSKDDPHGKGCNVYSRWEDWCKAGKPDPECDPVTGEPKAEFPMKAAEAAKGMGVFFYNLGDENMSGAHYTPETCFCDRCQVRFREFLKRMYGGSLEKINAAHHAKYASWDEIRALSLIEAAKARRLPLWTDFRAFMDEQFTNAHRYYCEQIKRIDPEAKIGAEGYPFTHCYQVALDYRQMLPMFGFCAPYFSTRDAHAVETFLPEGGLKSAWYGSYEAEMNDVFMRRRPWQFLFNNMNGAFWWTCGVSQTSQSFSNCTIYRPDLTYLRHFDISAKEIRFIKESGIGRIMNKAKAVRSGVYVHYSNKCLYGAALNPTDQSWEMSMQEFGSLLEDMGVSYRYLAQIDLENVGVPADAKIVVLPYSQLMGAGECANIRQFVERGGLVLADKMPAEFTEHGYALEKSPLADLFDAEPMKLKATGKGAAMLTGDFLRGLDVKVGANRAAGIVAGFADLFATKGVKAAVKVTDENDSIRRADIFQSGDVTMVCMLGPNVAVKNDVKKTNTQGAENASRTVDAVGGSPHRVLATEKPVWAYDFANGGKLLGHGTRFELDLEPIIGRVVAIVDKEVLAPELTLSKDEAARGEKVTLAWKNVVGCAIVTAKTPDGKVVMTTRTTASTLDFVPGYNEPEGDWTLEVRSAVGGEAAIAELDVSGEK